MSLYKFFFTIIMKTVVALLLIIAYIDSHKNNSIVYILVWTEVTPESSPFGYLEWGHDAFIKRNCSFQNCYLTPDHLYFDDVLDFDALMFNTVQTSRGFKFPPQRSQSQLYILVGVEPAVHYPLNNIFREFFNLSWTYKLNSDVVLPYVVVKNKTSGQEIGPLKQIPWLDVSSMEPTDNKIISKLLNKSKAGIMIASNCNARDRLIFVNELNKQLAKYNKRVDTVGKCGYELCPQGDDTICHEAIEKDYYFYMAFENAFCDDYVTEKLWRGLKHYAVPIVYGGADYSRFVPHGIYLNALELGVENLAKEMNSIINDQPRYFNFFRWHKYYEFLNKREHIYTSSVCELCATLNNVTKREQKTFYQNIIKWWNQNERKPINFNTKNKPRKERSDKKEDKGVTGFFKQLFDYLFPE